MFRWFVVFGVLAACGDGIAIPDAPAPDADERKLVTVEIRSARVGSGARVFFQDRESNLLTAMRTDPAGVGNAYLFDTTSIVTIELTDSESTTRLLYTIPGVQPGDHVVFDDGTRTKTTSVTLTAQSNDGAVTYQLLTACGQFSLEADLPTSLQLVNCGTNADMLLLSPQDQYLYRPDVGIFEDQLISLEGTYENVGSTKVRVNRPSPTTSNVQVEQLLLDDNRALYRLPLGSVSFNPTTTSAEATMRSPTWPDARVMTRLRDISSSLTGNQVLEWGPRGDPTEIDLDRGLMRQMLTFPRYHPDTRTVSWLERDQGALPDATLVQLRWTHQDGNSFSNVVWRIFVERTNNSRVTFPLLPDPVLQPTDAFVEEVTSFAIDGGYERLRALHVLGRWSPFDSGWNDYLIDAPTGRLVYQTSNSSGGFPDF